MPADAALTPEQQAGDAPKGHAAQQRSRSFTRLTLGMFAQSFAHYPLTFTHVGQAESADGKADIIEVKGEGDFAVRLFIDTQTHLPLMLAGWRKSR